jgi:hypothetical protein
MADFNSAFTGSQIDAAIGKADTAVQPADDAATLGSGAALDGYVLSADGAGGAAWEEVADGVTDYVRTRAGTTQDIFDMAETWNDAGTTFTSIKMDVTDTASNASSLLMDLQVGGVSRFSVSKNGSAFFGNTSAFLNDIGIATPSINVGNGAAVKSNFAGGQINVWNANTNVASLNQVGCFVRSTGAISWGSGSNVGTPDLILARDAANTLAQRRGTNAQTFNLYNTYTDASNYERARLGWAGNVFEIKPQAAGTGTVRTLHISGLPTSDPSISGVLWNDAGTVKVSA